METAMTKRRDDWFVKAGQAWAVLVKAAASGTPTTYKKLGTEIGLHHRVVRYPLGLIQDYCVEEHLPILAAIVVNAERGKPGAGSIAAGRDDLKEMQAKVFAFAWDTLTNPFGQLVAGETLETLTNALSNDPDSGEAIYARVQTRGIAQQVFRSAVTQAYGWRCAMCGLSYSGALEAAHIIRWPEATHQQRIDPRNGLLLCATHHRLFDAALITVSDDYLIRCHDPDGEDGPYSDADEQATLHLHGKHLKLPERKSLWPQLEWIRRRREADEWED